MLEILTIVAKVPFKVSFTDELKAKNEEGVGVVSQNERGGEEKRHQGSRKSQIQDFNIYSK